MDLRPTFQHYYPEGTIGPGTGNLQGQCAVFAQSLVTMPLVGDTIKTKKRAVDLHGILKKDITEFKAGDVLILDIGTDAGHVAVLNNPATKCLSESNWDLNKRVHHTRTLENYNQVYGIFRGPLKVAIINPPLQKTYMKITVVANKLNWSAQLPDYIVQLNNMFKTASSNRLEIVADIVQSDFSNIPFKDINTSRAIDVDWYRQNVTPLGTGQLTLFVLNPVDYPNGVISGYMSYGDPNKPVRAEIATVANVPDELGVPHFVGIAFHEIAHALFFLSGVPDVSPTNPNNALVHDYIFPFPTTPERRKALLDLVNYQKLQETLITINPTPMAQIKSQAKGASRRIVLEAADVNEWAVLCKVYGKDKDHPEEVVN